MICHATFFHRNGMTFVVPLMTRLSFWYTFTISLTVVFFKKSVISYSHCMGQEERWRYVDMSLGVKNWKGLDTKQNKLSLAWANLRSAEIRKAISNLDVTKKMVKRDVQK